MPALYVRRDARRYVERIRSTRRGSRCRAREISGGMLRKQAAKVVITPGRFGVEQQGFSLVVYFDAKDGPDAGLLRRLHKLDGAVQIADVGQGNGGTIVAGRQADDGFRRQGRIKE